MPGGDAAPRASQTNHTADAVDGDDVKGIVVAQPVFRPDGRS
ncbi:MAG TPA: hypothetical protein VLL08_22305 [Kineosporiaceae bacterium]|nr:hypothetical protein [Kineosporiaceae bacterium]